MNVDKKKQIQAARICTERFENNMVALKIKDKNLYDRVRTYKNQDRFNIIPDIKNEVYNLYIKETNSYYYEEKNLLYNVKLKIDELNLKNAKLAIFLGMGLGYELLYFLKELSKEHDTRRILVVEKDIEIFIYAMNSVNLVNAINSKAIQFAIGEDVDEFSGTLDVYFKSIETITLLKATQPVYYPSAMKMNQAYYLEVMKAFREIATYMLVYYGNCPEDSLIGLEHMFENINEIVEHPGINELYDKFKGKPALVVASGPSLEKDIPLLKKIQNDVLIICAQSTLKILLNNDIKPHIVTTLERVKETTESFRGLNVEDVQDVYLAACPVIPKSAYEVYPGPRLVAYRKFDHFKWLQIDKGMLDIKLSSANMAFKLGVSFGADPIILLGQDLCYAADEKTTHISGHVFGTEQKQYTAAGRFRVPGNYDETVLTNKVWKSFLESYEVDLRDYDGTCINATSGGAFIRGTILDTFENVVNSHIKKGNDILGLLKESLKSFNVDNVSEVYEGLSGRLTTALDDIDKIMDLASDAIGIIQDNDEKFTELLDKETYSEDEMVFLNEISDEVFANRVEMTKFKETFQLLLMHVVQPIYLKYDIDMHEIPKFYDNKVHAQIYKIRHMLKWYAVVMNVIRQVKLSLENAHDNITNKEEMS